MSQERSASTSPGRIAVPSRTSMMSRTWPSGLGPGRPRSLRHLTAASRIAAICSIVQRLRRRLGPPQLRRPLDRVASECIVAQRVAEQHVQQGPGLLGLRRRHHRLLRQETTRPGRSSPRRAHSARTRGGHGGAGRSGSFSLVLPARSRSSRSASHRSARSTNELVGRKTPALGRDGRSRMRSISRARAAAAVGPVALTWRSRPSRSRTRVSATRRPPSRRVLIAPCVPIGVRGRPVRITGPLAGAARRRRLPSR